MARKRILIVEDERDVAILLQQWLARDYDCEIVSGGAEAMKRVYQGGFDLILLDYSMRDIKGDRVCLILREDEKLSKLPIVIITGHIEVDEKIFKEYGATDVLYKPVEGHELLKKIEGYLSKA